MHIERAEALGEPLEDPLLQFSILYGFWVDNLVAFNADVVHELSVQFLALAEKQRATVPLMIGHRLLGVSLLLTGHIAEGRAHLDRAIALYDPMKHRRLATRFGQNVGVAVWSHRSRAAWLLGYPEAALRDNDDALRDAREIGQAQTLMLALLWSSWIHIWCGNYVTANAQLDEEVALADEKGAPYWKAHGITFQGCIFAMTGRASAAIQMTNSEIATLRSKESTQWLPSYLSHLAIAYSEIGQFAEAWRCIDEAVAAVETTKERWCEAEVHRTAGEIALMSPNPDAANAEAYFERTLAIARVQQAKSWELRAATSTASLWRDQSERQQAHDLLAPVYGWPSEGFDLKEAKTLLKELAR